MKKTEFAQKELSYRYALLQEKGKKLATLHYPQSLFHLYTLEGLYVELRLDPERYTILSADVFDEEHPRYAMHMERLEQMEAEARSFEPARAFWGIKTKAAMLA